MISTEPPILTTGARSPLAQLLHALNQPLTGLQCSMEVALALPRTREQYADGLREGLELTGRMRVLVAAIREAVDCEEERIAERTDREACSESCLLDGLLREALNDFSPVAETKRVRILEDLKSISSIKVGVGKPRMNGILLRLLDSILSVAAPGTSLRVAAEPEEKCVVLRISWRPQRQSREWCPEEVAWLVVEAQVRSAGGEWERVGSEGAESITLRLPYASSPLINS